MTPSELNHYLQEWDNASKPKRSKILEQFINTNIGKTAPELEDIFNGGASLLFSRLTAWLRLSYMTGCYVEIQLRAILVFVGSSNGHKFLTEFIEVGGVLTLLEILGLKLIDDVDKREALKIITIIANIGRKYKELICESFGIKAVAECLARSNSIECQDACKNVLQELSVGNPKYLNQVYKALISLLRSSSPEAQQIAAQILQNVQPMVESASISIVDPVLMLLRSLHLEVQYEGFQLIKLLISYDSIKTQLLNGLVGLVKPSKADLQDQTEILSDTEVNKIPAPLPVYIQQAASAKLIGLLSKESKDIAKQCIQFDLIHNLLYAMGNNKYADSQKQAGITLHYFIQTFPQVESKVRDAMGQTFFFEYTNNAASFYLHATPIHMDILLGNKVKIK